LSLVSLVVALEALKRPCLGVDEQVMLAAGWNKNFSQGHMGSKKPFWVKGAVTSHGCYLFTLLIDHAMTLLPKDHGKKIEFNIKDDGTHKCCVWNANRLGQCGTGFNQATALTVALVKLIEEPFHPNFPNELPWRWNESWRFVGDTKVYRSYVDYVDD